MTKSGALASKPVSLTCNRMSLVERKTGLPKPLQSVVLSCTVHRSGIPTQKLLDAGVNSELHNML